MKLKKFTLSLAAFISISLPFSMKAATIEYSSQNGVILGANGFNAADGDIVELGTFTSGFNFVANTSFSALNAAFTLYDTTTIVGGQFYNNPTWAGLSGIPLYIWIFNVTSTPVANPGAWAIVKNPSWLTPDGSSSTADIPIDTSDSGTVVPTGALGIVSGADVQLQLAAVPEPSSIAFLASGLLMAGSMIRRRK
jgi:hypothetical protein